MNTVQIKSFLTAAELLNFTEAAKRLYISQPTLSHQIAMLEQEVGSKLFTRKNNVLLLTQSGAMLKRSLTSVSVEIDNILRRVRETASPDAGYLSVGLLEDQLLDGMLIDALHQIIQQRPKVEINIERRNVENLFQGLMDGTLDVAVHLIYDDIVYSDFQMLPLSEELEYIAISKKHPIAKKQKVSMQEIEDLMYELPLVMAAMDTFPQPMREHLAREYPMSLMSDGAVARIKMVSSLTTIPLYITAGLGFSFVNKTNILSIDPNVELIAADEIGTFTKGLTWRKGNENPVLDEFLEIISPEGD